MTRPTQPHDSPNPNQRPSASVSTPPLPQSWQHAWRVGIAPLVSTEGLEALLEALTFDDTTLIQGATTTPPPLMCVQDWPVEVCCAMGYCGWKGDGLETVGEVEEFFAHMCYEADKLLGEPAGVRWFLNWFDETPREHMRRELSEEVQRELAARANA